MGGTNNSSSNQTSSGSNQFQSDPTNLTNPAWSGFANSGGPLNQGMWNALTSSPTGGNPQAGFGTYSGSINPSQVYNPATGGNVQSSDTANNPLVAGVTPQQTNTLNQVNAQNAGGPGTLNYNAADSANFASNQARDNPITGGQSGYQAYAASGNANSGYGMAQNQANIGANSANLSNFGQGTAGQAAGYAGGANFGGPQAGTAANTADTARFGQGVAGNAAGFANQGQLYGAAQPTLSRELDPNYAANLATSPQTMAAVRAAVNPLIQSFNAQTVPGLQGVFSAAGQRVNSAQGVGGSSAFDTAGANALTGLGANIGQTASNIVNPAYQAGIAGNQNAVTQSQNYGTALEQGMQGAATTLAQTAGAKTAAQTQAAGAQTAAGTAQSNALNQAATTQATTAGAQTQAQLNAAQTQAGINTQQVSAQNATSAQEAALNTGAIQNLATAATTGQSVQSQQLNNTINTLNANALPQLTQQYGINQGLQLYNSQVNQLMTALGLGVQAQAPSIGNVASGSGTSQGHGSSSSKGVSLG